jgi:hypothetical protein
MMIPVTANASLFELSLRMSHESADTRLCNAKLVFRAWTPKDGLTEHEESFTTLSELMDACLKPRSNLPDRITLTGTDQNGREHALTFSFASLVRG